ncbi:MAG: GNAT family N-acetyltransferase [Fimbriimonas sp.]|nr:GNAT family N-acetyltransferase [Fimbriimonas sp.]
MLTQVVVDAPDHPQIESVRTLFREYETELNIDLCFQGFEAEIQGLPGKYAPPSGVLLLMLDDLQPVACGAMRPLEPGICELKRIYVRASHRGSGLGKSITCDLMARAGAQGYEVIRLDTLRRLVPALSLYESLGFSEIQPYNINPELDVAYFERRI